MADEAHVLAGRYNVGRLIGRGGMADVYIGHDTDDSRTVAIKVLRPAFLRDSSFHSRFQREARAAAHLDHPSIVTMYDTGDAPYPQYGYEDQVIPYIVMEYVEGRTIGEVLTAGESYSLRQAAQAVDEVLSALEHSHLRAIIHRDIKPDNVMLTPAGDVKVMDFGIARALSDESATITDPDSPIGTARYMSPEQARGEDIDTRSDLYSAGCLLFELVTGRPPFLGDSAVAVASQHARDLPEPPSHFAPDIPDGIDRVAMKSLAKDPDSRYQRASDFQADLASAFDDAPVDAPAVTAWGAVPTEADDSLGTVVPGEFSRDPTAGSPNIPVIDDHNEDDDREV